MKKTRWTRHRRSTMSTVCNDDIQTMCDLVLLALYPVAPIMLPPKIVHKLLHV